MSLTIPLPQVPHCQLPAQVLLEQIAERLVSSQFVHRVREEFDPVAAIGDQAAHPEVVSRPVFNGLKSAELRQVRSGGNNGRPDGELDSVQLPSNQEPCVEIGDHSDGLKISGNRLVVHRHAKACHGSDLGVRERSHYSPQIIRLDRDIAIAHNQSFVLRFAHQAAQLCNFVVGCRVSRSKQDSNALFGKIADNLFNDGEDGIVGLVDAEKNLIFGIILAAQTGKILVVFRIHSADWFQDANRRRNRAWNSRAAKEPPRAVECNQIVDD